MRTYARGLLVLALLAGAARADEEPKIAWKFDQPFSQKWTTKVKQTIKATGEGAQKEPVVQTQEVSLTVLWTPAKEKDKKQPLKVKIEDLTVKAQAGGETWTFDSGAEGKAKGPLAEALGKLKGVEVAVTLNLDDMTAAVEGLDEALKGVPAEQKAAVDGVLNKDTLTRLAEAAFPKLPVEKGKSEKKTGTIALGALGTGKTETTLTYEDVKDKLPQVKVQTAWEFTPAAEGKGPVTVKAMKEPKATFEGLIVFDPAAGRIQKSTLTLKGWKRTLTLTVGEGSVEAEVTQEYEATVESAAAKPPG